MSLEEFEKLLNLVGAFGIGSMVSGFIVFYVLKSFVPTYLSKKAENLATREDITEITEQIERVRSQHSVLLEELKITHQLRLAALDRRLQAHQEAFSLWRELYGAAHTTDVGKAVLKCQDWWERNCLYLEPQVREAFVDAYSAAHTHQAKLHGNVESNSIKESWKRITNFPNIVFAAIQLPPLTKIESTALNLDKTADSGGMHS